ncbi:MAG: patatin-like phospholipase family protein [Candidatus Woesearchaeota archaeon]
MKVGLCLGSGGSRGIAHIGIIEKLVENGFTISQVSGASIGAFIGGLYCAGSLEKFKKDLFSMTKREIFSYVDLVFPKSGFIQGKKVMALLERYIPKGTRIEDLPIPLAIVATDYNQGEQVVFRQGDLLLAIRASISIPGIFVPVKYHESILVDGGLVNPLPVDLLSTRRKFAVNLYPPVKVKNKKAHNSTDVGMMQSKHRWRLSEMWKKEKEPNVFEILSHTVQIMEHRSTQFSLMKNHPDVLFEPQLLELTIMDFTKNKFAYEEGLRSFEIKDLKKLKI